MITLTFNDTEYWDEDKEEFIPADPFTKSFEHSLLSISKWEAKWKIPYLTEQEKTVEQIKDYIKCTCLDDITDEQIDSMSINDFRKLIDYFNDSQTASTIYDRSKKPASHRTLTSELIYAWMAILGIPFECDKWNFNRLFMLIRITSIEKNPDDKKNKMSTQEILAENRRLNELRKAKSKMKR